MTTPLEQPTPSFDENFRLISVPQLIFHPDPTMLHIRILSMPLTLVTRTVSRPGWGGGGTDKMYDDHVHP